MMNQIDRFSHAPRTLFSDMQRSDEERIARISNIVREENPAVVKDVLLAGRKVVSDSQLRKLNHTWRQKFGHGSPYAHERLREQRTPSFPRILGDTTGEVRGEIASWGRGHGDDITRVLTRRSEELSLKLPVLPLPAASDGNVLNAREAKTEKASSFIFKSHKICAPPLGGAASTNTHTSIRRTISKAREKGTQRAPLAVDAVIIEEDLISRICVVLVSDIIDKAFPRAFAACWVQRCTSCGIHRAVEDIMAVNVCALNVVRSSISAAVERTAIARPPSGLLNMLAGGNARVALKRVPLPNDASSQALLTARSESIAGDAAESALAISRLIITLDGLLQAEDEYCLKLGDDGLPVLLGLGRYATCEEATHVATGECVAIKKFRYLRDQPPRAVVVAVEQEVRMIQKVGECRQILKLLGGWASPRPALVFELASAGSLNHFMLESESWSRISSCERVSLLHDVACALAHMHSCHVVHRDVKSHNVMIFHGEVSSWQAKLGDLGAAAELDSSGLVHGEVGSTGYVSPEVFSGHGYDIRCDVWSMGVLIWEVMTSGRGENPLSGKSPEVYVALAHNGLRPKITKDLACSMPAPVVLVMEKCWNYHPSERPDAPELVHHLENTIASLSSPVVDCTC
jgi:hypothetical protein